MQSKLRGKLAALDHTANTRVQQSRGAESPIVHPENKKKIPLIYYKFNLTVAVADNPGATGSHTIDFFASISHKSN